MSGFGNFGARAYVSVGVETGVSGSSPHALILMLYDGALESLRKAIGCIEAGDPWARHARFPAPPASSTKACAPAWTTRPAAIWPAS